MKNCVICFHPVPTTAWKLVKVCFPTGYLEAQPTLPDTEYVCPECLTRTIKQYALAHEPAGVRFQREMNEKYGSRA